MTREEAARTLAIWKDKFCFTEGGELVIDLAIKALEQPEPCEDAAAEAIWGGKEMTFEEKEKTVIDNYFKVECSINITLKEAYTRGFKRGFSKASKPKTGKWLINSDGYYPYCSECKAEPKSGEMTDYCPKCGAKMEG